jgi:thiamine-monophosphate kinase
MRMDLTEDELIAALARVIEGPDPNVVVGMGDDAAVLAPPAGCPVLTTDLLVEHVHFERDSISARDLGKKAIVVNVSDIAAMGGSPRCALASIALPADIEAPWVVELYGGMREACLEHALSLVGGDTNRGDVLVLSVTVVGEVAPGRAVHRSGARAGDAIVVTGELGAAAGGLALSRAGATTTAEVLSSPWGRRLADALARPVARVGEGQTLARCGATAMMDLSDGLAKDLSRLCVASGVGARLDLAAIPVSTALRDAAPSLGVDPLELALGGGEDYELLATLGPDGVERATEELRERFGVPLTVVGAVVEGTGVTGTSADGRETVLRPSGWDHFA